MRRLQGVTSRAYPKGDDPFPVLVAKAVMALNALRALDPKEAEAVARAYLAGQLTPTAASRKVIPWTRPE